MEYSNVSPAEIQKKLEGMDYPASKKDLIEHVKKSGETDDQVVNFLQKIPEKDYKSPLEVSKAVVEAKKAKRFE